jgi:hypothetical protein
VIAAAAVAEELDRRAKIAELDAYLAELDAQLGPLGDQKLAAAREWADHLTSVPNTGMQHGAAWPSS